MPAWVKVWLNVCPVCRVGDVNFSGPSVTTMLCGAASWLVHVTVSPTAMLRLAGVNL